MAFLFSGPPKCSLVQRGGERESETVQVKLPRQHLGRKGFFFKTYRACSPADHPVFFYGHIGRRALKNSMQVLERKLLYSLPSTKNIETNMACCRFSFFKYFVSIKVEALIVQTAEHKFSLQCFWLGLRFKCMFGGGYLCVYFTVFNWSGLVSVLW